MAKRLDPAGYLHFAMKEHVGKKDARGLMPLAAARKIAAATKSFGDTSDVFHAALCSLKDSAEVLRVLKTKRWYSGDDWAGNTALAERYGAELMPWLVTLVDAKGKRRGDGNFPSLLEYIATPEALELLFGIWKHWTDPEKQLDYFLELQSGGWESLAILAERGHVGAREAIVKRAKTSPSGTKRALKDAIGAGRAEALLAGSATVLDEAAILDVLDAAARSTGGDNLAWPDWGGDHHFAYHAMRVIAARAKTGDDWGLLFEVVQGDEIGKGVRWRATIQQYRYGSRIPDPGGTYLTDDRPLRVIGKEVDKDTAKRLDLRPGRAGGDVAWPLVLKIRAALARDPGVFWLPPAKVVHVLGLGAKPQILVDTAQFAHVVGKQGGKPATLPSKSPTYRSLAKAIATRNPTAFVAGTPNTDWRLHAAKRIRDPFA